MKTRRNQQKLHRPDLMICLRVNGLPKGKKLKESYPPPDRLPSSEYCDSNTDDEEENENGVTLHEELHEELYGLPTPRKCVAREGSGEIAPTELEQSPDGELVDDTDDDDGVPLGQSAGQPSGDTTGAHKDQVPCMAHLVPHCYFLMWYSITLTLCYT